MQIEKLFLNIWKHYISITPQARRIHELIESYEKAPIINDHIALRTLNTKACGIDVMAKSFLKLGFQKQDEYSFEQKHLKASSFIHPHAKHPKVFISALDITAFSPTVQNLLNTLVQNLPANLCEREELPFLGRIWDIEHKTYTRLLKESEYAAWFYVFGFRANHFTVFINALRKLQTLKELNNFLKEAGFRLNSAGGEIKGSPEVFLEQSATMAEEQMVVFKEGVYSIPSCFYEFAKRYELANGELFQGFITSSADKIFESTHR